MKNRGICTVKGCANNGRYCRVHIGFAIPKAKVIKKESEKRRENKSEGIQAKSG
jgi:hypothetical protein